MTNKKADCGCLFPLLPCLYSLNPDDIIRKQHSNEIDRQIARDKEDFVRTHRLLLLGAGESGKSTIIKQMQLIHVDNFSETVRRQRRDDIRDNLVDAIVSILAAMSSITPPVKLDNPENETMAKWVLDHATKQDFDYPEEFYQYTKILWKDKGVQVMTFERSNEYQLIDSAKYFLDQVDVIGRDDYIPTDQDILRCRVLTTGIYELNFQVNSVKFQIIDVGGQRDERRKWFLCFNDVTAIIFVTACSSYNMVLREDASKNRLRESLELFKIVWNNRWLGHISVILFLNKQDLFKEKILSGRSKLEDYFPDFKDFDEFEMEAKEHPEVARAKYFIRRQFENISEGSNYLWAHRFYPHFTCAVDTENVKKVFDNCRDTIQRKYLKEYDLI
ncbi:guanine nucleotide-binding protein G(s) subunit alpha-like [Asbolus verrucosus]|uniref:Guanine nucleotide-binding protein G(s) subunit alpha n=1 Tax=Asbolus verrucosus TaxID=1661398 RepID=A0A482VYS7_ASBVE|nr:guanine nucleotide-binding protein G(s) subunit alpha-like [Asbolus verrucosus]